MLSVTFLGTAGSTPTPKRGMPAIALRWQGKLFLWDCGEGTQRQMMKYKVGYGSLNAAFISHLHPDHFIGLFGLIETLHLTQPSPRPVSVFAPDGLGSFLFNPRKFVDLRRITSGILLEGTDFTISAVSVRHSADAYGFVFQEKPRRKFDGTKAHKLGLHGVLFQEIQRKGRVRLGGKTIRLGDVSWEEPGRKIVYSGDTAPCPALEKAATGADLLIHEATFACDRESEAQERLHTTAAQAARIAQKAKVRQLAIVHTSSRYADPTVLLEEARALFNNTILPNDGEDVVLK